MEYVIVFLAGAAAAASALLIGYFGYVSLVRAEQRRVRSWDARLKAESADLEQRARAISEKQFQAEETFAARLEQQAKELAERKRVCDEDIEERKRAV